MYLNHQNLLTRKMEVNKNDFCKLLKNKKKL